MPHVECCSYRDERMPNSEVPASASVPAACAKAPYTNVEAAFYAYAAHNLSNQGKDCSKGQPINSKQQKEPQRVRDASPHLQGVHHQVPQGVFSLLRAQPSALP